MLLDHSNPLFWLDTHFTYQLGFPKYTPEDCAIIVFFRQAKSVRYQVCISGGRIAKSQRPYLTHLLGIGA